MTKLIEADVATKSSLAKLGRDATKIIATDLFAAHPEVFGIFWMYRVPIRDPNDFVRKRAGRELEQDITVPHVLLPIPLVHGLNIPCSYMTIDDTQVAVVDVSTLVHVLPSIVTYVDEIFVTSCELKLAFKAAWGESTRIMVYRRGSDVTISTCHVNDRSIDYHEDITSHLNEEGQD